MLTLAQFRMFLASSTLVWGLICGTAHAATQGELGNTSQGSVEITLTIKPTVRISQLQDIRISSEEGESAGGSSPICLFASSSGQYTIKATGSGPNQTFGLQSTDNSSQSVPYQVALSGPSAKVALTPGTPTHLGDAINRSLNCENPNTLDVLVPQQDLPPGVYAGSLTLLISPN